MKAQKPAFKFCKEVYNGISAESSGHNFRTGFPCRMTGRNGKDK